MKPVSKYNGSRRPPCRLRVFCCSHNPCRQGWPFLLYHLYIKSLTTQEVPLGQRPGEAGRNPISILRPRKSMPNGARNRNGPMAVPQSLSNVLVRLCIEHETPPTLPPAAGPARIHHRSHGGNLCIKCAVVIVARWPTMCTSSVRRIVVTICALVEEVNSLLRVVARASQLLRLGL